MKHNGWVLVGLPSSPSQAAALASAGIHPAATIHINVAGKLSLPHSSSFNPMSPPPPLPPNRR